MSRLLITTLKKKLTPTKRNDMNRSAFTCCKYVVNPYIKLLLYKIYKFCFEKGCFPCEYKKANVVPFYERGEKQLLRNYRPISSLLISNFHVQISMEKTLISPNQLGFKTGDSCINQLLSITHEIYRSFDDGYEVNGVLLDVSKAFDKVWHLGLLYKLRPNGITSNLLNTLTYLLKDRKWRVVLNSHHVSWADVSQAGGSPRLDSWIIIIPNIY